MKALPAKRRAASLCRTPAKEIVTGWPRLQAPTASAGFALTFRGLLRVSAGLVVNPRVTVKGACARLPGRPSKSGGCASSRSSIRMLKSWVFVDVLSNSQLLSLQSVATASV
jgi:hypothetical protein